MRAAATGPRIGGDVVLLGSLRFMQLMGVYMHEGTKVRNAVYLSVGGEMCGVFALNYAPSGKVRKSLRQIVDANGLTPVFATRDFLITPVLVEERYKVPNGSLRFPTADERSRLCQLPEGAASAEQGAVLTKEGVGAYADAVVGARIRLVTGVNTAIRDRPAAHVLFDVPGRAKRRDGHEYAALRWFGRCRL